MQIQLTAEQIASAESMSLEDLRKLAQQETEKDNTNQNQSDPARDDKGRFAKQDQQAEDVDDTQDADDADQQADADTRTIYRKEIDSGEGAGVQVFEADNLEDLVEKLAKAQEHASKKIRELSSQVKAKTAADQQSDEDIEYVISEKLKKNPKQTIKEVVAETIAEQQAAQQRSQKVQEDFVTTHPDYKKVPENGTKVANWIQLHGYTEFTSENLEKAYQDLKKSGLLVLEVAGADDATDANDDDTQRIAEDVSKTTQQRSQKKGSTITTSRRTTPPKVNAGPSEDEAYSLPLEKLRDLANKQLTNSR